MGFGLLPGCYRVQEGSGNHTGSDLVLQEGLLTFAIKIIPYLHFCIPFYPPR